MSDIQPPQSSAALARHLTLQGNLAAAIAALGNHHFANSLVDLIDCIADHDSALVLLYGRVSRPQILLNQLNLAGAQSRSASYVAGAYLLDPFYHHAQELAAPALKRMRDIAPGDFANSDYYITYYKTADVADEVNYLVPVAGDHVFAVCIERVQPRPAFSDSELERLEAWLPSVAALIVRHGELADLQTLYEAGRVDHEHLRLKARLKNLGAGVLTPREVGVVQLLLGGHDTQSIAGHLDLSHETIRVHRRNIYRKLKVSSIAELFSVALETMLEP